MSTRILGFDPGTATTGWGFLIYQAPHNFQSMTADCIITPAKQDLSDRLLHIHAKSTELIKTFHPDAIIIEKLFFNTNAKTAMSVGHARGVLLLTAKQSGIPIFEYTPLQIKQTLTGYGRADKKQVQFMVKSILKLESIPKPDDAADALAAAITHAFTLR
jgi:crossover junction endodeoxyribonuclease RuvC